MLSLLAVDANAGLRYFTAGEVLSPYVYVFYLAYSVSFCFTPAMRIIATYYGIIDQPDSPRKMHHAPVAYLGGIAVFLGWLAGLALTQFLSMHRVEEDLPPHLYINFSIVAGACIIVILGLWDDVLRITPWAKIGGQIAAAVVLLFSGVGTQAAWIFISPIQSRLQLVFTGMPQIGPDHWVVLAMSCIFVVAIIVFCCNATNLMDGLDGLCGGVTAIMAAGFVFLAVHLATLSGALNANEDGLRIALGLALLAAVLGFVPFNFNPASVFMGDTGSMFLGYACGIMIISFSQGEFPKWFLASMVMFALPILDTSLAFVRRWRARRPIFSPDRYHFHHQLVARGFTVKQTVVISYALALAFALLGAAVVFVRTRYAVGIYLVVFGSIVVAAYKMGMVDERVKSAIRQPLGAGVTPMAGSLSPADVLEVHDESPPAPAMVEVHGATWSQGP